MSISPWFCCCCFCIIINIAVRITLSCLFILFVYSSATQWNWIRKMGMLEIHWNKVFPFHIMLTPYNSLDSTNRKSTKKMDSDNKNWHCWWVPRTQVCLVWFELNDRYMHHGAFWCVGIFLYMCMWDLCFGVQIEIDSIHIHIANRMFQWIGILRIQELVSSSAGTIQLWFSYLKIHEASAPHPIHFQ